MSEIEDLVYSMDADELQDYAISTAEYCKELTSDRDAKAKEVERLKIELRDAYTNMSSATVHAHEMQIVEKERDRWRGLAEKAMEALLDIKRTSGFSDDKCLAWNIASDALDAFPAEAKENK